MCELVETEVYKLLLTGIVVDASRVRVSGQRVRVRRLCLSGRVLYHGLTLSALLSCRPNRKLPLRDTGQEYRSALR